MIDIELNDLLRKILLAHPEGEASDHSSPAGEAEVLEWSHNRKRVRRRDRFKRHFAALKLVLYQGTWPHPSIDETPLYEVLLLRMHDAFLRYGSSRWTNTFIEHGMVKILRQVGLEDLAAPERIVDCPRKRIERFENDLLAALKALDERRRKKPT